MWKTLFLTAFALISVITLSNGQSTTTTQGPFTTTTTLGPFTTTTTTAGGSSECFIAGQCSGMIYRTAKIEETYNDCLHFCQCEDIVHQSVKPMCACMDKMHIFNQL